MNALHVVFKVGDAEYAMPASEVLQMEAYEGATHVPGAASFVAGIVQVRGKIVPVVDVRRRFGLPAHERTAGSRLVIGQKGARPVALLVDTAREVLQLDPETFEPPPRVVAEGSNGYVKAVARKGERLLMLIDFEKVIGEEAHGEESRA